MGKKQNKQSVFLKRQQKTIIGRPQDDVLQTFFMKKLRNGKLQLISAESQAEIECHKYQDKNENFKKISQERRSQEKMQIVKSMFYSINKEKFGILWESFKNSTSKWEFKEIGSISEFPKFLFCDECDISYVLYQTLNSNTLPFKRRGGLADDELLFLELLCFSKRDQISYRILRSIEKNFREVFKMMEEVKSVAQKYSREIQRQQKIDGDIDEEFVNKQEDESVITKNKGCLQQQVRKVVDVSSKTKQIEKTHSEKRRGRPKSKEPQPAKVDCFLTSSQLEQVVFKLLHHIARAYAYIYPSQLKRVTSTDSPQKEQQLQI